MLVGAGALAHAAVVPTQVAVSDRAGEITYGALADLAARVRTASARWPASGPAPAVALVGPDAASTVAWFVALATAGWAVGVLDPGWSEAERAGALAQLAPDCVVAVGGAAAPPPPWTQIEGLAGAAVYGRAPAGGGPPSIAPGGIFYVGFTSGSAGRPKAFARSHVSWTRSFTGFDHAVALPPGDVLVPGPLASSHFLFGVLHGLDRGRTVAVCDVADLVARVDRGPAPAAAYVVPTMLDDLAARCMPRPAGAPALVMCAGAQLTQRVRDNVAWALPATGIVEYYGASELSFVAIRTPGDGAPPGSVGRAFPGVSIAIRADDHKPVAAGDEGLIWVRSGLVFAGYRGAAPSGAARCADGWWTVGDRGRQDVDGNLFVAGRGTALILVGGANVQPEEVEGVLATLPGVAACAVVGVPSPRWGEELVAVVVPTGVAPDRATIRRALAGGLSQHKRPRRYLMCHGPLPAGRAGKVDRARVRELVLTGELAELT